MSLDQIGRMAFDPTPLSEAIVCRRNRYGHVATNVPWTVIHHSPDGFDWGYAGSAPADFALNILEALTPMLELPTKPREQCYEGTCSRLVWFLHQPFKWEFLTPMPREGGRIDLKLIQQWLAEPAQAAAITAARELEADDYDI